MPGSMRKPNFAIAMSAPVLPADTTQSASPDATASIASRIDERRPVRSATEGRASSVTISSVWWIVARPARRGSFVERCNKTPLDAVQEEAGMRKPLQRDARAP